MTETIRYGIDVSEWQGTIQWERVAAAGVEFAMIRATHGQKQDARCRSPQPHESV